MTQPKMSRQRARRIAYKAVYELVDAAAKEGAIVLEDDELVVDEYHKIVAELKARAQ